MRTEVKKRYFGTDGIRGKVGAFPISPDFVLKLGWAFGTILRNDTPRPKVVIGKDTRVSGYMFESALEAGFSAAGVDVYLLGPMPTPGIAYLTRTLKAQAGIVISASHNPYYDNGIKFFSADGLKLDDKVELAIEAQLAQELKTVEARDLGKAIRVEDAAGRYLEYGKSTIPHGVDFNGLKIVVDGAHGANYSIAPQVFEELGAEVIKIGCKPDGFNINHDVGSTHPEALCKAVKEHGADIGVAFDGDADRVQVIGADGKLYDGDDILYILCQDSVEQGGAIKQLVCTVMSNLGFEQALARIGIEAIRVPVGDRYVSAELIEKNLPLGGEPSGHILNRDFSTCGDGLINALQVIRIMKQQQKSLAELTRPLKKFPQKLVNVRVSEQGYDLTAFKENITTAENKLGDKGRVLVRASGTEPVIRIMVEAENETLVNNVIQELESIISTHVSRETSSS